MDINEIRKFFPVNNDFVFLNNAAESPLNTRTQAAIQEYLNLASQAPHKRPEVRQPIRLALSDLFGASPSDYALTTSTGHSIATVAAGYKWKIGDNVVLPADEHWNNIFPWLAQKHKGVEVRLAPLDKDNKVPLKSMADLVNKNTRFISTTAVRFDNGFRADLKALSKLAKENGALLVVDGIQAAGSTPLNVEEDGIDILCCGGFKWLLGMPGTGFMYISAAARELIKPVLPGMFAAEHNMRELNYHDDARMYETGSIAYSLFHGWQQGLNFLRETGIENIYQRNLILTDKIIKGLLNKQITILSPIDNVEQRSAIITFTLGSDTANRALHKKLTENGIIVALRQGAIRISPNFYNNEEDINRFFDFLQ